MSAYSVVRPTPAMAQAFSIVWHPLCNISQMAASVPVQSLPVTGLDDSTLHAAFLDSFADSTAE
jgi:hypothetical protein